MECLPGVNARIIIQISYPDTDHVNTKCKWSLTAYQPEVTSIKINNDLYNEVDIQWSVDVETWPEIEPFDIHKVCTDLPYFNSGEVQ